MNQHSSRSHMMLTVKVLGTNEMAGITSIGTLHLIDLAGSERLSRSHATGDRLLEARNINRSLAALGNVMEALQKKQPHVPYRDSKLTFLLQDSLGGRAKALMVSQPFDFTSQRHKHRTEIHCAAHILQVANVSPSADDAGESLCSLEFASRVGKVSLGKAVQNMSATGGNLASFSPRPSPASAKSDRKRLSVSTPKTSHSTPLRGRSATATTRTPK
jgi:kinesin family protein C2/C3